MIQREPGTLAPDGTSRSLPTRLLSPALMELGNGRVFSDYDNALGRNLVLGVIPFLEGQWPIQTRFVAEQLFGADWESHSLLLSSLVDPGLAQHQGAVAGAPSARAR